MQQVNQHILSFCVSMHIIICISVCLWGCACKFVCKFLQDFRQKYQLCFLLEGVDEHQTNPTKWLFNQTDLNSALCSSLASLPTPPLSTHTDPGLLSHSTDCFAAAGEMFSVSWKSNQDVSILSPFWTSLVFGAQSSCLQLRGQEGLGHLSQEVHLKGSISNGFKWQAWLGHP